MHGELAPPARAWTVRRVRAFNGALLGVLALFIADTVPCLAHQRDEAVVYHYLWIEPEVSGFSVQYAAAVGGLLTTTVWKGWDRDGNGTLDTEERRQLAAGLRDSISLRVDGKPARWRLEEELVPDREIFLACLFPESAIRLRLSAAMAPPDRKGREIDLRDDSFPHFTGVFPAPVVHSRSLSHVRPSISENGRRIRLRLLPLGSPGAIQPGERGLETAPGAPEARERRDLEGAALSIRRQDGALFGRLETVRQEQMQGLRGLLRRPLSPGLTLLALAVALVAGIAHALMPGHGKSMVAAYLAGTRGRVSDALVLGAVVAVSHTGLVFVLGLATLWVTTRFSPASVEPILAVVSGVLVLGLGFWLFQRNLADFQSGQPAHGHRHGDEQCPHEHPGATGGSAPSAPGAGRPGLRGLATAGLAGGIVPCTDALAILLAAVHLGNIAVGLAILGAFSLGLAGVLMLVGVLTVRSVGLAARFDAAQRWVRLLPVLSAGLILFIGAWITVRALQDAGWLHFS